MRQCPYGKVVIPSDNIQRLVSMGQSAFFSDSTRDNMWSFDLIPTFLAWNTSLPKRQSRYTKVIGSALVRIAKSLASCSVIDDLSIGSSSKDPSKFGIYVSTAISLIPFLLTPLCLDIVDLSAKT